MPPHLIDVRTPAEFAAAPPLAPLPGAVNIEHQAISALAAVTGAAKDDDITLYCRSGRRSALALVELRALGFVRVRDIGGLEAARATWEGERRGRLAGYAGGDGEGGKGSGCGGACGHGQGAGSASGGGDLVVGVDKEALERSHAALLQGLRALQ